MNDIAYWGLLIMIVLITVAIVSIKRISVSDYIMELTVFAVSAALDTILSEYFNLYHYVSHEKTLIYSVIYDALVYPCFGIVVYTGWYVIPYSIEFYIGVLAISYIYCIMLKKVCSR